jgi:Ca-activated chloride channel homolog
MKLRCLLLFPALLLATPALAQTSFLVGTVSDASSKQPAAGVVVTATSPSLQGEQVVVTDASGYFRIPALPSGEYTLRFEKEGLQPYSRSGIQLRAGYTLRINVEMLPTGITEQLVVQGSAPTIDVGSTSTGINVGGGFVRGITVVRPTGKGSAGRSFESLADIAPGANIDPYGVSISGTTSPENSYVIDGVNPKDPGFGYLQGPRPEGLQGYAPVVRPSGEPHNVYSAPSGEDRMHRPSTPSFSNMFFQSYGVNPTVDTEEERFSTFSIDTDTASYTLARSYLERGALPEEQAVRVEEFVNSFDYGYTPDADAPFALYAEALPSPHRRGYHVVHVGLKAKEVSASARKPSHLVFVIDVSGSMAQENRLGLVKQALRLLVDSLDERDRVSIVVYGSDAYTVLQPTSASDPGRILAAIDSLQSEGSTNAQAGLELGYALAAKHLRKGGINRVVLCSDGVANNGVTDADGIWRRVRDYAEGGVTLSTVGFGMGNYNDVLMERLAQVGEGNYAYVDRLEEAQRIFVQNLSGTLQVVAKDVKVQVEFNPAAVVRYRLLGYENRMLAKEQFQDDRVDAGEVGAGHSVTALYEVKLTGKSQAPLATLRVRYKAPEGGRSQLLEKALPRSIVRASVPEASDATRLSLVAAAFAEKLRGSYWVRTLTWEQLAGLYEALPASLRALPRVEELGRLLRRAQALDGRPDRFEALAPAATMDFDRPPRLK